MSQGAHSIAKNDLVTSGKFGSYPNIFELQERPEVTARLEAATAGTVLQSPPRPQLRKVIALSLYD